MERHVEFLIRKGVLTRKPTEILKTRGQIRLDGKIEVMAHYNHSFYEPLDKYVIDSEVYFFLVPTIALGYTDLTMFPPLTAVNITRVRPFIGAIDTGEVSGQPCGESLTIDSDESLRRVRGSVHQAFFLDDAGELSVLFYAGGTNIKPYERIEGIIGSENYINCPLNSDVTLRCVEFERKSPENEWKNLIPLP